MKNNNSTRPRVFRTIVHLFTLCSLVTLSSCTKDYFPNQDNALVPVSHSSCVQPTDLQVFAVSMTKAVITWKGSPTAYEYRVIDTKKITGVAASEKSNTVNTTKNGVELTNLSPKTVYTFRITSVCHDDPATPWAEISFRTSVE